MGLANRYKLTTRFPFLARSVDQAAPITIGGGLTTDRITEWLTNIFERDSDIPLRRLYTSSSTVYKAVRIRADTTAEARLKFFQVDRRGNEEWVGEDHPVQKMWDSVHPRSTRANYWRSVETRLSLDGESFDRVRRQGLDVSRWTLEVIPQDKMEVTPTGFIFDPHGKREPLLPQDVIYQHYYNPFNPTRGFSPLIPAGIGAQMGREMLNTNRNLFKNGINPQNLAVLLKQSATPEQLNELEERLTRKYSGANSGKPFVGSAEDWEVTTLNQTNRDMEFVAGLIWSLSEVSRCLDVPRPLLGDTTATIYNNVDALVQDFYTRSMRREWELLAATIEEVFIPTLPPEHRRLKARFDYEVLPAFTEDADAFADRMIRLKDAGIIDENEARDELGYDQRETEPAPEPPTEEDEQAAWTGLEQVIRQRPNVWDELEEILATGERV